MCLTIERFNVFRRNLEGFVALLYTFHGFVLLRVNQCTVNKYNANKQLRIYSSKCGGAEWANLARTIGDSCNLGQPITEIFKQLWKYVKR